MKILITGSTGLIGQALTPFLQKQGHEVSGLKRIQSLSEKPDNQPYWHIESGTVDFAGFKDADVIVHLAGKNIADKRWSDKVKAEIIQSREIPTKLLVDYVQQLESPPATFICASAIGFYGNRGDEILTEKSVTGKDFVSEVCRIWEGCTEPLQQSNIRVANLRTGLVVSTEGGAMKKMLPPFKLGLGGNMGNGEQYYSWISIDDMVSAIHHIIDNTNISGPVNMVSPNPVTNAKFTKALGTALSRPTIFPMPAVMAKIMFGEMAEELLLSSTRVIPQKLTDNEFEFQHKTIDEVFNAYFKK